MKRGRKSEYLPPHEGHHDSPGIYLISMPGFSSLVYIGSAAQTIRHRWRQHVSDLRAGRHGNPLLQRAVNKYGIDKLHFEILEMCTAEDVLGREQEWFSRFLWDDLFNINPNAASRLGAKLTEQDRRRLAASHGGVASPTVLREIAEDYRRGATQKMLADKHKVDRSSIRNYLTRQSVDMRRIASQDPEVVATVKLLYEAGHSAKRCAQEARVDHDTALRILRHIGLLRGASEAQRVRAKRIDRGQYARAAGAHIHEFHHPVHGTFHGFQFELRAKFKLSKTLVSRLCRGQAKQHQGWRLVSNPQVANSQPRSGRAHHFVHPKHGEFIGRQSELIERFGGMTQSGVSALVTGRSVSYKEWEMGSTSGNHVFRGGSTNTRTGRPRNRKRKIPIKDYPKIRSDLADGVSQTAIAARYGVHQASISNLCKRQGWLRGQSAS
jgi:group I intron endonuclease